MNKFSFARYTQVWIASSLLLFLPLIIMQVMVLLFGQRGVHVTLFDWWIMAFYAAASAFLILQKKMFWFFAILILYIAACLGFYHSSNLAKASYPFDYQFTLAIFTIILIGYIFYFFRFPYLDGRDTGLFGIAHRYDVDLDATVDGAIVGKIKNASMTGVLFKAGIDIQKFEFGQKVKLTIHGLDLVDISAEIRGIDSESLRLKYSWLGYRQFKALQKKLLQFSKMASE